MVSMDDHDYILNPHLVELKRMLIEHDVLSSLDALLLLLVPLALFCIGITSWLLSLGFPWHVLALFSTATPIIFLLPLGFLVQAKFTGSIVGRVRAWATLFHFLAIIGSLLLLLVSLRVIVGETAILSLESIPLLAFGIVGLGHGLASHPVRSAETTLKNRIPWRTAEIEAAFRDTFVLRSSYLTRREAVAESLIGLALLLLFAGIGVQNLPAILKDMVPFLLGLTVAVILFLIASSLARRKGYQLSISLRRRRGALPRACHNA